MVGRKLQWHCMEGEKMKNSKNEPEYDQAHSWLTVAIPDPGKTHRCTWPLKGTLSSDRPMKPNERVKASTW